MSQYKVELQRECCLDGMRETPLTYNCERRSEYIIDGADCIQAFLHCCKEMESQLAERKEENLVLARSKSQEVYCHIHSKISTPDITLSY